MRLWSLQDPAVAKTLADGRVYRSVWKHTDKDFRPSYRWMVEQMKRRGLDTKGRPPVWAFHSWETWQRKPDMRMFGSWIHVVRLTLEIPDDQALLSNHDTWHIPLNKNPNDLNDFHYLAVSETDYDDAERRFKAGRLSPEEMLESWQRIFDPGLFNEGYEDPTTFNVQACLTHIRPEWVVNTEHFKPRKDRVRPVYPSEKQGS